jgi:hypothetical protein
MLRSMWHASRYHGYDASHTQHRLEIGPAAQRKKCSFNGGMPMGRGGVVVVKEVVVLFVVGIGLAAATASMGRSLDLSHIGTCE